MITYKAEHVSEALAKLISQFSDKEKLRTVLTILTKQFQELEDIARELLIQGTIDGAVGAQLDDIGLLVGEERSGRLDTPYRVAIKNRILINIADGTPNAIAAAMATLVGHPVKVEQYFPKTMYVTSPILIPDETAFRALLEQVRPAGTEAAVVVPPAAPIFQLDKPFPNGLDSGKLSKRGL